MEDTTSEIIFAVIAVAMAILGIVCMARAVDTGFFVFGLGLTLFGVLFGFFLLRRHYDRAES